MKKLFFSAIALVAFSGISMANTVVEVAAPRNCSQEGISARDCAYECGSITWAQAEAIGDCVSEKCLSDTKNVTVPKKKTLTLSIN